MKQYVLLIIDPEDRCLTYVLVRPEMVSFALSMKGRHLQEPGDKPDMDEMFRLLGKCVPPTIDPELGMVIESIFSDGIYEIIPFWYDGSINDEASAARS